MPILRGADMLAESGGRVYACPRGHWSVRKLRAVNLIWVVVAVGWLLLWPTLAS